MLSPGVFGIVALLILIYVVWRIVVSLFQSSNIIDSSTDIPDISPMVLTGSQQAESDLSSYFPTSLARTTAPNVPDPAAGINSTVSTADKLTSTEPNVPDSSAGMNSTVSSADKLTSTAPNTTTVSNSIPDTTTVSNISPNIPTVSNNIPDTTTSFVPDSDIPNGSVINVEETDNTVVDNDE